MFRIDSFARHLLLLGIFLSVTFNVRAQAGAAPDPLTTISRGSLRSILAPRHDIKLSSPAAGVVEKLYVAEGSRVATGNVLLSLDSQQETAEVAQAQATLRGIEAEYERAGLTRTQLERKRSFGIKSSRTNSTKSTAAVRWCLKVAVTMPARVLNSPRRILKKPDPAFSDRWHLPQDAKVNWRGS